MKKEVLYNNDARLSTGSHQSLVSFWICF